MDTAKIHLGELVIGVTPRIQMRGYLQEQKEGSVTEVPVPQHG